LSGQEYVHEYAKRKLDEDALEPERTPSLSGPPLPDVVAATPA
ncbi:MAG: hypothetical protein QOD30_1846, partial [Actinomycetota bacterium]|nr:hypothetical protein [Actinomycetota bacterium]